MATIAPVNKLKKSEIVWLNYNRCRHNHTYLEHYNCFLEEIVNGSGWEPGDKNMPIPHRVGYFDIETTDFSANVGMMLCYCILDDETDEIKEFTIKGVKSMRDYRRFVKEMDKDVIKALSDHLKKFDRIITYYGSKFDVPFSRTRSLHWGLKFPEFQELIHTDVYYMVRSKLKLNHNRLETACRIILGDKQTNKTRFNPVIWRRAGMGDPKSLEYIIDHCRKDVVDLKSLHRKMQPYVGRRQTSV